MFGLELTNMSDGHLQNSTRKPSDRLSRTFKEQILQACNDVRVRKK